MLHANHLSVDPDGAKLQRLLTAAHALEDQLGGTNRPPPPSLPSRGCSWELRFDDSDNLKRIRTLPADQRSFEVKQRETSQSEPPRKEPQPGNRRPGDSSKSTASNCPTCSLSRAQVESLKKLLSTQEQSLLTAGSQSQKFIRLLQRWRHKVHELLVQEQLQLDSWRQERQEFIQRQETVTGERDDYQRQRDCAQERLAVSEETVQELRGNYETLMEVSERLERSAEQWKRERDQLKVQYEQESEQIKERLQLLLSRWQKASEDSRQFTQQLLCKIDQLEDRLNVYMACVEGNPSQHNQLEWEQTVKRVDELESKNHQLKADRDLLIQQLSRSRAYLAEKLSEVRDQCRKELAEVQTKLDQTEKIRIEQQRVVQDQSEEIQKLKLENEHLKRTVPTSNHHVLDRNHGASPMSEMELWLHQQGYMDEARQTTAAGFKQAGDPLLQSIPCKDSSCVPPKVSLPSYEEDPFPDSTALDTKKSAMGLDERPVISSAFTQSTSALSPRKKLNKLQKWSQSLLHDF